jgi:hypothetical protein
MEVQWSTPTAPQVSLHKEGRLRAAVAQFSSLQRGTMSTASAADDGAPAADVAADSNSANDTVPEAARMAGRDAITPVRRSGSQPSSVEAAETDADPLLASVAAAALLPGVLGDVSHVLPMRTPAASAADSAAAGQPDVFSDSKRQARGVQPAALAVNAADAPMNMLREESSCMAEFEKLEDAGSAEDAPRPTEASAAAWQPPTAQPEESAEGAALTHEERAEAAHEGEDEDQYASANPHP